MLNFTIIDNIILQFYFTSWQQYVIVFNQKHPRCNHQPKKNYYRIFYVLHDAVEKLFVSFKQNVSGIFQYINKRFVNTNTNMLVFVVQCKYVKTVNKKNI